MRLPEANGIFQKLSKHQGHWSVLVSLLHGARTNKMDGCVGRWLEG
jgi:hypothetical protein